MTSAQRYTIEAYLSRASIALFTVVLRLEPDAQHEAFAQAVFEVYAELEKLLNQFRSEDCRKLHTRPRQGV